MRPLRLPRFAAALLALSLVVAGGCASTQAPGAAAPHGAAGGAAATTPQAAFDRLQAGNARYLAGPARSRDYAAERRATAAAQHPFAAVVSCMDSRVPPEVVFDQGLGDLFSLRVAGNVANPDIVGSLEYATEVAGVRAVLVLGHTACGAVKGACDHVELGSLTGLLARMQPAVAAAAGVPGAHDSKNHAYVDAVTEANVRHTMHELVAQSPLLAARVARGEAAVRGAVYDLETGVVRFLDPE